MNTETTLTYTPEEAAAVRSILAETSGHLATASGDGVAINTALRRAVTLIGRAVRPEVERAATVSLRCEAGVRGEGDRKAADARLVVAGTSAWVGARTLAVAS